MAGDTRPHPYLYAPKQMPKGYKRPKPKPKAKAPIAKKIARVIPRRPAPKPVAKRPVAQPKPVAKKKPVVKKITPPKKKTPLPKKKTPAKKPPAKPKKLTLAQWLAKDSEYQDQLRQFGRTWTDFLADVGIKKARVGTDYQTGKSRMADQRLKDLDVFKNDYAGRGMLHSGLYGARLGDYEKDYGQNVADLDKEHQRLIQDIGMEQSQFQREQELAKERARKAAAARRAAQF